MSANKRTKKTLEVFFFFFAFYLITIGPSLPRLVSDVAQLRIDKTVFYLMSD